MPEKNQDPHWMSRALELAKQGEGRVEPNPMVGCVLVKDDEPIGEGWHQEFGGPHAEAIAIDSSISNTSGATAYVTLEPCSHHGKTPPCCQALMDADVARVVIARVDPNPKVSGEGIRQLQNAGIEVTTGVLEKQAEDILAPYLKRLQTGMPWIVAKWAMTLDGKIATSSGDSQWISNQKSRSIGHDLRARVDGIMVGSGTANSDDPLLTARPKGARTATRIVLDSKASLSADSQLCRTADKFPTLIAVGPQSNPDKIEHLRKTGCEVWCSQSENANDRLTELLQELGKREMTNILVEGGGKLLGSLNDLNQIDEFHIFIGPKLVGGSGLHSPVGGVGQDLLANARQVQIQQIRKLDDDVYILGRSKS